MPIMQGPQVTIDLTRFFHWFITGTLTVNLTLLLRIIWWITRYYRKYKNAIMMFIEEHEELVADYNRRHPGQEIYFAGKKSRLHITSKRHGVLRPRSPKDPSDDNKE